MKKLYKDTLTFVFFNYVSLFVNTARGIVLIFLLGPAELGVYKLFFTYSSYFRYYNLGINALAFYRAPLKKLQATYATILYKLNTNLAFFFGAAFCGLFIIVTWKVVVELSSVDLFLYLFVILFFTQFSETYVTIAKIYRQFNVINKFNLLLSATSLGLTIALGFWFKLRGVILGLTISTVLANIYIVRLLPTTIHYRVKLTWRRTKILFSKSIVTILPGMLTVLFSSLEIWVIASKFGASETGYYTVVTTLINILLLVNTDSIAFIYANKSTHFKNDRNYVLRLSGLAFMLILGLGIICIPLLEIAVNIHPKYEYSYQIYKWCFWGMPFLVFKNLVVYFISNNRMKSISIVLAVLVLCKFIILLTSAEVKNFYIMLALTNVIFGCVLVFFYIFTTKKTA